ncbi:MAG TPA: hypothetical protein VKQ05_14850 [Gemmatimonadales bacterium]|nr:hypothetical protein [Gemmatimonadales bacterium]
MAASLGAGAFSPLAPPPGQGAGWAKLAAAVEAQVPPGEIETIYVFRPIKREGKEWGTAVVTRKAPDGRLRVYTAKYMLIVRGKDRGQSKIEVVEVALSPAEVLAQVMQATVDRGGGDTEPPVELGPAVWYEGR